MKSFGMWLPNTDPSGSGLIMGLRFRGQEGAAAADAPMHSHLGALGVTGFLMKDVTANPLDYVEGGKSAGPPGRAIPNGFYGTNPDLSAFQKRSGKSICRDRHHRALVSPASQLDYYQSVLDKMGRSKVDGFARFYVLLKPATSQRHELRRGRGWKTIPARPVPNSFDRVALLMDWVEKVRLPASPSKLPAAIAAFRCVHILSIRNTTRGK